MQLLKSRRGGFFLRNPGKRWSLKQKAFTLIEVVVSMVILSVVSILFMDTLVTAGKSLSLFEKRKDSVYMVNFTLRRLLKDCRYIKRGGMLTADASHLIFNDSFGRTLEFRLNGTNVEIRINTTSAFSTLAENIGSLHFMYFDKLNNPISSPVSSAQLGNIQWLSISVSGVSGLVSYSNTAQVFPREMFR